MAQMIDFLTKPPSKDAKKQSHKGGSPESPKPFSIRQFIWEYISGKNIAYMCVFN